MTILANTDHQGEAIVAGDNVKILSIPAWLTHDLPEEDVTSLKRLEGTVMKVLEIDAHGYVWFGSSNNGRWFCLRPNELQVIRS